jgi:hypothetical protein
MTLIDTRPLEINARTVAGHWERDLIIGKNHISAMCITVERKTRFMQLDLLTGYDAQTVRKTIEKRFKKLEKLNKFIKRDQFKGLLTETLKKEAQGLVGRPPFDYAMMLKILILQKLYDVSDDHADNQTAGRLSFRRFQGRKYGRRACCWRAPATEDAERMG